MTYSLLRVEERVRGLPSDTLRSATSGGTLDGCTQTTNLRPFRQHERLLLFLGRSDREQSPNAPPLYYLNGGETGRQPIADNENLAPLLAQPPPRDLRPDFIIPLDRAPVAPSPTPRP